MTIADYIKQRFAYIGVISDAGASDFAVDFGFDAGKEASDDDKRLIGVSINNFIEGNIMHPTSVDENGFSASWGADAIKSHIKLMLRKYGIELNGDAAELVGLSVIRDISEIW
jgi:hypothetical protein